MLLNPISRWTFIAKTPPLHFATRHPRVDVQGFIQDFFQATDREAYPREQSAFVLFGPLTEEMAVRVNPVPPTDLKPQDFLNAPDNPELYGAVGHESSYQELGLDADGNALPNKPDKPIEEITITPVWQLAQPFDSGFLKAALLKQTPESDPDLSLQTQRYLNGYLNRDIYRPPAPPSN